MKSHYTKTVSAVFLLFCLFITSGSSSSFIRQVTDDFNTNLQRKQTPFLLDLSNIEEKSIYIL